jgi:hypothetical protein
MRKNKIVITQILYETFLYGLLNKRHIKQAFEKEKINESQLHLFLGKTI